MGTTHTRETFSHTLILRDTSSHSGIHRLIPGDQLTPARHTEGHVTLIRAASLPLTQVDTHIYVPRCTHPNTHQLHPSFFSPTSAPGGMRLTQENFPQRPPHSLSKVGTRDLRVASSLSTGAPSTGSQAHREWSGARCGRSLGLCGTGQLSLYESL